MKVIFNSETTLMHWLEDLFGYKKRDLKKKKTDRQVLANELNLPISEMNHRISGHQRKITTSRRRKQS